MENNLCASQFSTFRSRGWTPNLSRAKTYQWKEKSSPSRTMTFSTEANNLHDLNARVPSTSSSSSSSSYYIYIYIYVMELGHLLTHSGLTYPEVSSKVYHDSFCQLGNRVLLLSVICFEAFYLHVGPEAKGSNPTTALTLLWAGNPFRGNFNHWQVSHSCKSVSIRLHHSWDHQMSQGFIPTVSKPREFQVPFRRLNS